MKKVSVIIPCRNEKNFIEACIQSVVDSSYPETLLEVIVCDGLSDDGTLQMLQALNAKIPLLKILTNPDRITSSALNLGIRNSSCDYFIILGAHSSLDPSYVAENVKVLEENPDVWCSGGVLKNQYADRLSKNIAVAMSSPFGVGSAHFRTGVKEGYVDTVAFGMYREEVVERIGWFDETLVRNQDDEFNYRILKAGGKIWLTSKSFVNYFVRSSWKKLFSQYFQYGYWKVYVNKKHKSITTARQLVPFFFVLFLVAGLISSLLFHQGKNIYLAVLIIYLALAIGLAVKDASTFKDVVQIIFSFFILHTAYGLGYATGIWDFLIRNHAPLKQRV